MAVRLITHRVVAHPAGTTTLHRHSIGGHPFLPVGQQWPECSCGEGMTLYFQLGISKRFGLPFQSGSQLSIFMCPAHNDAPGGRLYLRKRLPKRFWDRMGSRFPPNYDKDLAFFRLMLHRPGVRRAYHPLEPHLNHHRLSFVRDFEKNGVGTDQLGPGECGDPEFVAEPGYRGISLKVGTKQAGRMEFKVGGQPSWAQLPEDRACPCGAPMVFVCEVPEGYKFPENCHDPLKNTLGHYLLLGNEVYVFACRDQCDPLSVYPVVQD